MRSAEAGGPRLIDRASRTRVDDGVEAVALGDLARGASCLGGQAASLAGRSVLLATTTQVLSAAAMVELDGLARRLTLAPPDAGADDLRAFVEDAGVDAIVTDTPDGFGEDRIAVARAGLPLRLEPPLRRTCDTQWVLATSGTAGRPKLVAHTLAALTGAFAQAGPGRDGLPLAAGPRLWATFYDIRRYGGLQILLRAVFGGTDLAVGRAGEPLADHLRRLGKVTSLSGTPSHWRGVLMSRSGDAIAPSYIRLSGEIADQGVLDALRAAYPGAAIGHAYASTEAGVGFAVDDGRAGFPASLLREDVGPTGVAMKLVEGSLRIRSTRTASHYLGAALAPLLDDDGFVDTGDLVEVRGGRCVFTGRRGGIINVGGLKVNPEEVEAAINTHAAVQTSLVFARRNPLTGSLVTADVVLRDSEAVGAATETAILDLCRASLPPHKVPVRLRFVPALPLTPAGKLRRDPAVRPA